MALGMRARGRGLGASAMDGSPIWNEPNCGSGKMGSTPPVPTSSGEGDCGLEKVDSYSLTPTKAQNLVSLDVIGFSSTSSIFGRVTGPRASFLRAFLPARFPCSACSRKLSAKYKKCAQSASLAESGVYEGDVLGKIIAHSQALTLARGCSPPNECTLRRSELGNLFILLDNHGVCCGCL